MSALTFSVYQAKDGWRWRLKAANGRIVAESGEAYTRTTSAIRAAKRLIGAQVVLAEVK